MLALTCGLALDMAWQLLRFTRTVPQVTPAHTEHATPLWLSLASALILSVLAVRLVRKLIR